MFSGGMAILQFVCCSSEWVLPLQTITTRRELKDGGVGRTVLSGGRFIEDALLLLPLVVVPPLLR